MWEHKPKQDAGGPVRMEVRPGPVPIAGAGRAVPPRRRVLARRLLSTLAAFATASALLAPAQAQAALPQIQEAVVNATPVDALATAGAAPARAQAPAAASASTATVQSGSATPTLSSLTITYIDTEHMPQPASLRPAFSSSTTSYRTAVANGVDRVTVTAVPSAGGLAVVSPADADTVTPGHQVALPGSNDLQPRTVPVTVTVTAADNSVRSYTVRVTRQEVVLGATRTIDWGGFTAGLPDHHNANQAKAWLLTVVKFVLDEWWNDRKDYDEHESNYYLSFPLSGTKDSEERYREPSAMALALAVALSTGAYDATVTGVDEQTARSKAVKLVRSLAYRLYANQPGDKKYDWQGSMWVALTGLAGWLLWDHLASQERTHLRHLIAREVRHRPPLYYRDSAMTVVYGGGLEDGRTGLGKLSDDAGGADDAGSPRCRHVEEQQHPSDAVDVRPPRGCVK